MGIEEEIFKQYKFNREKLISFGFVKQGENLVYKKELAETDFEAVVEFNGQINGKITDLFSGEEYTNFRLENAKGFSAEIRQKYTDLLCDIREKCCEKELFQSKQAQNINACITKKYKDMPEFLWKNFPSYAIYRNPKNKKWYALIGSVQYNKVNKKSKTDTLVEILNLKTTTEKINDLLKQNGIYEAYHMNKKNWITIILDGTLNDTQIENLVNDSYNNINR